MASPAVSHTQRAQENALCSPRTRFAGLDGLRAIALLAVLGFHVAPARVPGGFAGVDVFFVISGFLITSLLLTEYRDQGRLNLAQFYVKRVRRLAPAAVLMLTVTAFAAVIVGGDILVGVFPAIGGIFTLSHNWVMLGTGSDYFASTNTGMYDNFWSLAVEEQFYLFWPVVLLFLLRRRWVTPTVMTGFSLAALSTPLFLTTVGCPQAAYLSTFGHMGGLALGATMAVIWDSRKTNIRDGAWGPILIVVGLFASVIVFISPLAAATQWQSLFTVIGSLIGGVLIWGCLLGPKKLTHLLDMGILGWLGRRSYGIYLWHLPLIVLFDALVPTAGQTRIIGHVAVVLLAVVVASLSYTWVERPAITQGVRNGLSSPAQRIAAIGTVLILLLSVGIIGLTAPAQTQLQETLSGERSTPRAANNTESTESLKPDNETAEKPPENTSTSLPVVSSDAPMVAVGDSVMLASEDSLVEAFPNIRVDAEVSRQLVDGPALVQEAIATTPEAEVVIIGLGVNGVGGADDLRAAVTAAGDRYVVVVSVSAPIAWEDSVNANINSVVAEFPQARVAHWQEEARSHPENIAPDGIHPDEIGGQLYADSIVEALSSLSANDTHQ